MAWLYEKSGTWRKIVAVTKANPLAMAGFSAACFGVPYYLGKAAMDATNPELKAEQEQKLRQSTSMHQKVRPCWLQSDNQIRCLCSTADPNLQAHRDF